MKWLEELGQGWDEYAHIENSLMELFNYRVMGEHHILNTFGFSQTKADI